MRTFSEIQEAREYDVIIVGSGAAGFGTACRLIDAGEKRICLVTEGVQKGTSRNAGSDKQTYYKLGLGGSSPDSVRQMAENLFAGGCTDGDNALCEAALSARCFYRLCELGVPFPHSAYGEYVGYKTDHDPFARATSAGPLTSRFMTEALEKEAMRLGATVFDNMMAIEILQDESGVCGLLCLGLSDGEFVLFRSTNIVLATGGPAGIYADSVYPRGQYGALGLAAKSGVKMQNLTEWQFGLASTSPRWNVSGTYMQVLPRFVSVDADGTEHDFLAEYFADRYTALSFVFFKGYQWPFDVKKIKDGSSIVDILVYRETVLYNRRVYLDYTKNPFGLSEIDFSRLHGDAYAYLNGNGACFGTPFERLEKMNAPAVELYRSFGHDLETTPLEIALCAQHHNGGISVSAHWQTSLPGLFAVGECAGTHGITRPGGSALNAGQVGALRVADYISHADARKKPDENTFAAIAAKALEKQYAFRTAVLAAENTASSALIEAQKAMRAWGGAIRNPEEAEKLCTATREKLTDFSFGVQNKNAVYKAYRLQDILLAQYCVLSAITDYSKKGASRGSALYTDPFGYLPPKLSECFRFTVMEDNRKDDVQEVQLIENQCEITWRKVRPIPEENTVFEEVWKQFRDRQC